MDSMDMYLDRTFLYSRQRHLFKKNMGAIIESEHLWFCSKFTRIPGRSLKRARLKFLQINDVHMSFIEYIFKLFKQTKPV